uniref:Ig-like domain-containing protein n=1 Tax=Equus asinus asinus TaxID=83772 RepID=A0A8C4LQX6_EQUAS
MWLLLDLPILQYVSLTHMQHILILGTLESGSPKNLTCSVPWACEHGTHTHTPIFSWTSDAVTSLDPRTKLSSVLTFTPQPQDHSTNLTCQVKFPAGSVTLERTIQLNDTSQFIQTGVHPKCLLSAGELGTMAGVIQGAVRGAGVTTLFALCLCFIFFIKGKTHRRKNFSEKASHPSSAQHIGDLRETTISSCVTS